MSRPHLNRYARVLHFADRQNGFVTSADLKLLGVPASTASRWNSEGLLHRHHHGIYRTTNGLFDFSDAVHLANLIGTENHAIGGVSALRLWNMPGGSKGRVQLYGPNGLRCRSAHVESHQLRDLRPGDVVRNGRIRVTTPLRSVIDASPYLDDKVIGQQVSWAEKERMFTADDLALRLAQLARRGKRGVRRVLSVLADRDPERFGRPLNSYEKVAKRLFTEAGFPPPIAQHPISYQGRLYFVDFAWPNFGIVVECDSMLAHSTAEQFQCDLRRQNDLMAAGWTILRFTYWDIVRHPAHASSVLARHLPTRSERSAVSGARWVGVDDCS
ncbi:MAG: type IV toxin-antitoxin system AbiEi family antitoxin domain-containing protein [Acidimicrobiales bacterium]|nr:type IV toxin-antitoxin system AbiEi family antitoxin domain-containing protein [Acidimicrobiales bacterium]